MAVGKGEVSRAFRGEGGIVCSFVYSSFCVPVGIGRVTAILRMSGRREERLRRILSTLIRRKGVALSGEKGCDGNRTGHVAKAFRTGVHKFKFIVMRNRSRSVFVPKRGIGNTFRKSRIRYVVANTPNNGEGRKGVMEVISRRIGGVIKLCRGDGDFKFMHPSGRECLGSVCVPTKGRVNTVSNRGIIMRLASCKRRRTGPRKGVIRVVNRIGSPKTSVLSVMGSCSLPARFPRGMLGRTIHIKGSMSRTSYTKELSLHS